MRLLVLLLLTRDIEPLKMAPPGGELLGKYYVSQANMVTTSRDAEVIEFSMDKTTLTESLDALLRLKEIEERLTQEVNKEYKVHSDFAAQFMPTSLGSYLTVLGPETAETSARTCSNMGGRMYEISNPQDIAVITTLSEGVVSELKASGREIPPFKEFWQEVVLSKEKLPMFFRTKNKVPANLGNETVSGSLSTLTDAEQCAFINLEESTYSTAKCKDDSVKKNTACELANDQGSKRLPLLIARRQTESLKSMSSSITSLLGSLKLTPEPTTTKPEVLVSIFNKNETLIIKNMRTLKLENVSYKVFISLTNYNNILADNLRKLYNTLRTKDIHQILDILVSSTRDVVVDQKIEELKTQQIIKTNLFTTETQIKLQVQTGTKNELMLSASLHPLIFNSQQPQFSGHTLRSKTECLYNNCHQDPCHISTVIPVPCCNANVLGLTGHCPDIPSTKLYYLAALEKNKYLLVSSKTTTLSSHTCPNIHVKVSGTILITVDNQTSGCDIQVGDMTLPIVGAMSAEVFITPTKRNLINLINKFQKEFSTPDSQSVPENYLLPSTVVVGTTATVIGTALTLYLFLKRRQLPTDLPEYDDPQPGIPQPMESYPLRPILKATALVSNMVPYSDDSDTSSSPS